MRRSRAKQASEGSTIPPATAAGPPRTPSAPGHGRPRAAALSGPARHLVHGAVVLALVGGTAAVAQVHKTVTIDYDGHVATVDAYGASVADVLKYHHITPGPDDLVQPASASAVADGGEVVVRTSREVTVEIDGEVTTFPTTAHTVGELLAALGPRGTDAVTSASRSTRLDRDEVRVSTTKTVQIAVDGLVLPIRTTQSTVRDVLGSAGITLGEHDRTSVPLGAAAVDGMVVMVSRGDTDADRVTEVIPFETERIESDELPKGYEVVRTAGVPGERVTTYEVRTLDGAEVERTVLDREVTRKPVDEEIVVGTLEASTANPDPGSAKAIGKAMAAERGWGGDQFACLEKLWDKESGWRWNADNPSSTAYGIPQALPGSKMATVGSDWRTNPSTQIEWGLGYISGRYGTPCDAWAHSMAKGFY